MVTQANKCNGIIIGMLKLINLEERIMFIRLWKGKPAEQVYDRRYQNGRAVILLGNFSETEMQRV